MTPSVGVTNVRITFPDTIPQEQLDEWAYMIQMDPDNTEAVVTAATAWLIAHSRFEEESSVE